MKKIALFMILSFAIVFSSCKKDNENSLSSDDQKAIMLAVFNAGANGLAKSRTTTNTKRSTGNPSDLGLKSASIPINNDFEYDYPDGHGGNMHLIVDTGGYTEYDEKTYQCLGAFMIISVTEKITHYQVDLTNGRQVYIDTDPSLVYAGNFYLQPGCSTFDSAKSFFRITGTYRCNGIGYDIMLTTGKINADGSCHQISGLINGIPVDFVFN